MFFEIFGSTENVNTSHEATDKNIINKNNTSDYLKTKWSKYHKQESILLFGLHVKRIFSLCFNVDTVGCLLLFVVVINIILLKYILKYSEAQFSLVPSKFGFYSAGNTAKTSLHLPLRRHTATGCIFHTISPTCCWVKNCKCTSFHFFVYFYMHS